MQFKKRKKPNKSSKIVIFLLSMSEIMVKKFPKKSDPLVPLALGGGGRVTSSTIQKFGKNVHVSAYIENSGRELN